jgi:hypothetical protein
MKYTNYIINGNFNIDSILSDKIIFRQITILVALPVAFIGVIILISILPITIFADNNRYTRMKYYQYIKFKQKEKQIGYLIRPFYLTKQQERNIKSILINLQSKN